MARVENSSSKSSHWGIDACGDEIFHGDTIFEFPNGDVVLLENLPEYLIKFLGVKETTAK
ncbi:hypothetical protein NST97_01660 [Aeribacillus sp. FSL K6-1305]|uniref:YqaI family protein n=1 Tax=Aeribacillus sp. FSL K6-1305 TaxID=2954569 RepID=UPI0030FD83D6